MSESEIDTKYVVTRASVQSSYIDTYTNKLFVHTTQNNAKWNALIYRI